MYNHVKDSGKGDPMFYELTDDEIKLHDEKNQDYRSTSNPVANFDRVAAWMALYPDMDWARPEMVAVLYAQKQIDSAMSLMERGVEGGVETIDTRARDVHIYWKLFRVIRRKHVEVQSKAGPIRMERPTAREQYQAWRDAPPSKEQYKPSSDDTNPQPPSPSTDYVIGIDFALGREETMRIMGLGKPRTLWQRFLARIGM